MAFSNVVLTFTNDWIDTDKLVFSASSQTQSLFWTWITPRATAQQVETGTPTGTAGETAAANFKIAFDADITGYTTAVVSNAITITSTTDGEQFYLVGHIHSFCL
jgi:hypothetical protein